MNKLLSWFEIDLQIRVTMLMNH